VIASGETRDLAIARLVAALRSYPILGVRTNIPFLIRVLEHPRFRAGEVDTGFLDRDGAALCGADDDLPLFLRDVASASGDTPAAGPTRAVHDPWTDLRGWRA
jgi:3-methylcrotonyl-CoA carboxylase alpha subunit